MRLLSRKEEMLLLGVWKLQGDEGAYGVTIRRTIEKRTGIRWLFGAINGPLGRLVDYGYVESFESEPLPERGGFRQILLLSFLFEFIYSLSLTHPTKHRLKNVKIPFG